MKPRWRAPLLALIAALAAVAGCGDSGGGSPFRSLGKRGDSPIENARPNR